MINFVAPQGKVHTFVNNLKVVDNNMRPIVINTEYLGDYYKTKISLLDTPQEIGSNIFMINRDGQFDGVSMEVYDKSERGNGLGEILRLSSIINVLKNNFSGISIRSLHKAIPFHVRYKFDPEIRTHDSLVELLLKISKVKEEKLAPFVQEAIDLLNNVTYNFDYHTNYNEMGSNLVARYVNSVIEQKIPWTWGKKSNNVDFKEAIPMNLSREKIIEEKDFYNELFEKHKFDFEIK